MAHTIKNKIQIDSMRSKRRRTKELFYVEMRIAGEVPLFVHQSMKKKIFDGLQWCCDKRGLRIYEYCLLPDRLLMIVNTAWGSLPEVLESYKSFSSKAVLLALRNGRFKFKSSWMFSVFQEFGPQNKTEGIHIWEEETQMNSVYTQNQIDESALNILKQPVKLGLVEKPQHYLNCSAHPRNPLHEWIVVATDPWS